MATTRRGFILALGGMLFSHTGACAGVENHLLRPPGALQESDFLAKCNRCQKCVQVCPTRCIFPASFEHGIVRMNTPVVIFKNSYCNSCLKCPQICPTGALREVNKDTLDIGAAEIIEENCVAWDWLGCTVCVDKCPLKAVTLDENKRPVIDVQKCNGCGICQVECPSASLGRGKTGRGIVVKPRGGAISSGNNQEVVNI